MKIKGAVLALTLLAISALSARAQNITAAGSDCTTTNACVVSQGLSSAPSAQAGAVAIAITGTWSATLQFEGSATCNGQTSVDWTAINATPINSTTPATSTTSNGVWQVSVAGLCGVRVRGSAYTSGTATVKITPTTATANKLGGGGGGGGTVVPSAPTTPAFLPQFGSPTTGITNSPLDNGITTAGTVTSSEPIAVSVPFGTPAIIIVDSTNACPAPTIGQTIICSNSTNHGQMSINGGAYFTPADTAGTFTAAGSLTGTNTSQKVIGITTINAGPTTNAGNEVWLCKTGCADTGVNNWITNENPSTSQAWIVHDEVCGDTISTNPFVNGANPLIVAYKLASCKATSSTPTWVINVPIQMTSNNQRIDGLGGSMASGGVGRTGNSGIVLGQTFPLGVPQAPILPTTGSVSGASTVAFVANGVSGCNTTGNTTGFATGVNYYVVEEYANSVGPTNASQELGPVSQSSGNFECMTVTEPTNGNANATKWMVLATPTTAPSSGSEQSDGSTTYAKGSGTETIQAPPAANGNLGPVYSNMTECMIVLGHTWADGTPNTINSDYVGGIALDGDGAYGSEGVCNLAAQENTNIERIAVRNFGGVSPTLGTDGAGHVTINSVTYACSSARPCFAANSVVVEEGNTNRTPGANNSALDGVNLGDSDCASTTSRPWSHCAPNGSAADITLPVQPSNLVMTDNVNSLRWVKNLTATPNTGTGPNNTQCQVLAVGVAGNNALQSSLLESFHFEGTSSDLANVCMQGWRGTVIHPNGGSGSGFSTVTADANSFNYTVLDADPGAGNAITDTAQGISATQFPAGKAVGFWATGDTPNTYLSPYFSSFHPMAGSTVVALAAKGDSNDSNIFNLYTSHGEAALQVIPSGGPPDTLLTVQLGNNGGATKVAGALSIAGGTSGSATLSTSATGGTLNLGSTNATVTSAGALTVASCSGCGGGSPGGTLAVQGSNGAGSAFVAIPGASFVAANGSLTMQPTADAVPLTVKCFPTGVQDCLDVFNASNVKTNWIDASGNWNFLGPGLNLGAASQTAASFVKMYGSISGGVDAAPAYHQLLDGLGNFQTNLFGSQTRNGFLSVLGSVPGGDVAVGNVGLAPGGLDTLWTTGASGTAGLVQCPGASANLTIDCPSYALNPIGVAVLVGTITQLRNSGVAVVNIPSSTVAMGDRICTGVLSAGTYNAVDVGTLPCGGAAPIGYAMSAGSTQTTVLVQLGLGNPPGGTNAFIDIAPGANSVYDCLSDVAVTGCTNIGAVNTNFATSYTIPTNYLGLGKHVHLRLLFQTVEITTGTTVTISFYLTSTGGTLIEQLAATGTLGGSRQGHVDLYLTGTQAVGASAPVTVASDGILGTGGITGNSASPGTPSPVTLATNTSGGMIIVPAAKFAAATSTNSIELMGIQAELY